MGRRFLSYKKQAVPSGIMPVCLLSFHRQPHLIDFEAIIRVEESFTPSVSKLRADIVIQKRADLLGHDQCSWMCLDNDLNIRIAILILFSCKFHTDGADLICYRISKALFRHVIVQIPLQTYLVEAFDHLSDRLFEDRVICLKLLFDLSVLVQTKNMIIAG